MDGGTLHHPLETGSGLRVAGPVGRQARQVLVEEFAQFLPQLVEVDSAGTQDGRGIRVVGQAQQQMLQRGVFMAAFAGERQGSVQRLF